MNISALTTNIGKHIIGKPMTVELAVTAMLAGGHLLLEDVPGVGKTKLASAMAGSVGGSFHRIQMTPDVMPSDIAGYTFWNRQEGTMEFRRGVVFGNFLLADEINRCSPKTQSALLEAMEEGQVSVDGVRYPLEQPFMVIATQNPVETYGTYPLPEAQLDRFLMKLSVGYPGTEDSVRILEQEGALESAPVEQVMTVEELVAMQKAASELHMSDAVRRYIIALAEESRKVEGIRLGISPRGCLAMQKAARAAAYLAGEEYVTPDRVKDLAPYVWGHRLILAPGGRTKWGNGENAIREILTYITNPV
ncbi:MAG: MoxR family ATPase [Lachnospiraceae bacterium]|nr:MoxR family ATPase [Lachnospiraceae bacterium]